ncbi:hypothetical protein, partial [Candidatus Accumulibacter vicinus]|uniref:hypothetical protein n=1 Tax=Candidatus Accumulibacter vicinus TaxID=2954382 RepID=UPI00235B686A
LACVMPPFFHHSPSLPEIRHEQLPRETAKRIVRHPPPGMDGQATMGHGADNCAGKPRTSTPYNQ